MPSTIEYLYWDACVFHSYVSGIPDRVGVLDALYSKVEQARDLKIITSALSIAEVAFASGHGPGRRTSPEQEDAIDQMWAEPFIETVEAHSFLMYEARELLRKAADESIKKPGANDAIHLATAQWINQHIGKVQEIHTYDDWTPFTPLIGGITICEPHIDSPMLPFGPE